jgi:hypothetical protein
MHTLCTALPNGQWVRFFSACCVTGTAAV